MLQIGMRAMARRQDIQALAPRVGRLVADAKLLFPEIEKLVDEIVPDLMTGGEATQLDVKWLQQALNVTTRAGLAIDGDYGESTRAAVKRFQESAGLEADGWAGVLTEAALLRELRG